MGLGLKMHNKNNIKVQALIVTVSFFCLGLKGGSWVFLGVRVRGAPLPGSAEGLVCGGGHQVRVVEGRGDAPGRHQATDVGHVRQQVRLHLRAQLGDTQHPV